MADKTLNGAFNAPDTSVSSSPEKQSGGVVSQVLDFGKRAWAVMTLGTSILLGSYQAKAEEIAVKYESNKLQCLEKTKKDFAQLDDSIMLKRQNGFDAIKLQRLEVKRDEEFNKTVELCLKNKELDAQITQAETQITQAETQIADYRAQKVQATYRITQADAVEKQGEKIEKTITIFNTFINGAKGPEELKKLNELIAQAPTFSKEARAYVIAAKPVILRTEWGAERYAQLDAAVRRIEAVASQQSQGTASFNDSNLASVVYNAPQK